MAYEFNPYYFERNAVEKDYSAVKEFTDKLQQTLDNMSTVDEVYSLISFFEEKGDGQYPIFLRSMCYAAIRAAYSLTHPGFKTTECVVAKYSFLEWEEYRLDVPRYIFVMNVSEFPSAIWDARTKTKNF